MAALSELLLKVNAESDDADRTLTGLSRRLSRLGLPLIDAAGLLEEAQDATIRAP